MTGTMLLIQPTQSIVVGLDSPLTWTVPYGWHFYFNGLFGFYSMIEFSYVEMDECAKTVAVW